MKSLYLYLLFFASACFGQDKFLEKYNFSDGSYTLLGFKQSYSKINFADSKGSFYVNDASILNKIKKEWKREKPAEKCSQGTYYIVYLCKDKKAVETFIFNYDCGTIGMASGAYGFDMKLFDKYKDVSKEPVIIYKMLSSIPNARKIMLELREEKSVILIDDYAWVKYDGHLNCSYAPVSGNDPEAAKQELDAKLKNLCPGEELKVEFSRTERGKLMFTVKCTKTTSEAIIQSGITADNYWLDYKKVMDPNIRFFKTQ